MLRKLSILISLVLLVCMTSSANAGSLFWKGNLNTAWQNPNNWDQGQVPGGGDDALLRNGAVNQPHFTSAATTVDGVGLLSIGAYGQSGTFYMDSGSIDTHFAVAGCKNGVTGNTATAVMNGGTIKVTGTYWPDSGSRNGGTFIWPRAFANAQATWTMNGGLIDTLEFALPGYSTAVKGTFDLNGGTLLVRDPCSTNIGGQGFYIGEDGSRTSNCKGTMGISGGKLVLEGNYLLLINKYVDTAPKKILPYPADSNTTYHKYIVRDFDDRTDNKTTVTAVKTIVAKAWQPSPFDGSMFADRKTGLSWSAGTGVDTHKIYFGTNTASLPLIASQATTTVSNATLGGTLAVGKSYYWRVDEVNNVTGTTAGDLWTFAVAGRSKLPNPENGSTIATEPNSNITMSWAAGAYSVTHQLYIGTNSASLLLDSSASTTARRIGSIAMNTQYYWRVDEVNLATTVTGDVWNFTTENYRLVDNFEKYQYATLGTYWLPLGGMGIALTNGGQDYREGAAHHSGVQGMRLSYSVYASEQGAYRDLGSNQNWTFASTGAKSLTIWMRGRLSNGVASQLYVKLEDQAGNMSNKVYCDAAKLTSIFTSEDWTELNFNLASFPVGSFTLSAVRYVDIYVNDPIGAAPLAGMLFVDDIRLYPSRCVDQWVGMSAADSSKSTSDISDDCIVNYEDIDYITSDWLRADANVPASAQLKGSASWVGGRNGTGGVSLDNTTATPGWIDIDDLAVGPLATTSRGTTISFWFKPNGAPTTSSYLFATSNEWRANIVLSSTMGVSAKVGPIIGTPPETGSITVGDGVWSHVALTISPITAGGSYITYSVCKLYVNGTLVTGVAPTPGPAHYYPYLSGMCIGSLNNGSTQNSAMTVDDFRIYYRELTATEITSIQSDTYPSDTPVVRYDFNEGSGLTSTQLGSKGRCYHPTGYLFVLGDYDYAHPKDVISTELWGKETIGTNQLGPFRYVNMKDYALISNNYGATINVWP